MFPSWLQLKALVAMDFQCVGTDCISNGTTEPNYSTSRFLIPLQILHLPERKWRQNEVRLAASCGRSKVTTSLHSFVIFESRLIAHRVTIISDARLSCLQAMFGPVEPGSVPCVARAEDRRGGEGTAQEAGGGARGAAPETTR